MQRLGAVPVAIHKIKKCQQHASILLLFFMYHNVVIFAEQQNVSTARMVELEDLKSLPEIRSRAPLCSGSTRIWLALLTTRLATVWAVASAAARSKQTRP